MIEFLLVVYMGAGIISQSQTFADVDRCLYIAKRLNDQPYVSTASGKRVKMVAVCKPVLK